MHSANEEAVATGGSTAAELCPWACGMPNSLLGVGFGVMLLLARQASDRPPPLT